LCPAISISRGLTKGLLFDTFSITVWYKLCRHDHSVLELESFSPPELVDRTRNFRSNASQFKQKIYEKNAPQAKFLMEQNALQARFIKQNAPQARIFDEVLMGALSYLYGM